MPQHFIPKIIPHGQIVTILAEEKIEMDTGLTPIIIDGTLEIESSIDSSIKADNIVLTPRGRLKTRAISLESENNIQISGRWDWAGYTKVKCGFFHASDKNFNQNWLHLRKQVKSILIPEGESYPNGYVQQIVHHAEQLPIEDAGESIILGCGQSLMG